MPKHLQSITGMRDILPAESSDWQLLEQTIRQVLQAYGYEEIRNPIVEKTELFKRSIGEVTDIVEKEMYTFDDRNGKSLTLRPEGTACCVRACIQHGLLHNQQQRLWYQGPMFRYERPQKGRYRQFHQIGVEAFGFSGPGLEAELIAMSARMWRDLGIADVRLELNSLGSPQARAIYREKLVAYFQSHQADLDEDSQRRLQSNPLRILDSKNPQMQEMIAQAPMLQDYLDDTSAAHFAELKQLLDDVGIPYQVNQRLVRGLDYYTRTVFEWVTDQLGAQGTVCAGGRYDGLVEQLGGRATPAAGFAMGLERLLELLQAQQTKPQPLPLHAYLVLAGDAAQRAGTKMVEQLRNALPDLRIRQNLDGGSFKSQMKRADKSNALTALIVGDNELAEGTVTLKYLRDPDAPQQALNIEALTAALSAVIGAKA